MVGWRDSELRQNKFTGRNDDCCLEHDRDWRHLIGQELISDYDRDELHRVLAEKFLSETEKRMILRALDEDNDE